MLTSDVRRLNSTGWLLAILALAAGIVIAIPIGRWSLDSIDRSMFRDHVGLFCIVLAIPGLLVSVCLFWLGARALKRFGFPILRCGDTFGSAEDES